MLCCLKVSPQQVDDFTASELDALDQAHDHPHVGQHRRVDHARLVERHAFQRSFGRRGQRLADGFARRTDAQHGLACGSGGVPCRLASGCGGAAWRPCRRALSRFFFRLPGRRLVVRGAPLAGTLLAMVLPAAKRAPQVLPACVAGMREEANPAVGAVSHAPLKFRMGLQDRVQRGLIFPDKRAGASRPGANPRETRTTSRWLWQKSQAFDDNLYRFTHTLVLPLSMQMLR